ncbi:hypothetical protein GNF07_05375 [Trichormus variabilis FSR]|uniref:hypothetical protein n=1 Tax=Anabaena variabilis TaxID=264691 RepID=UPI001626282A|nr:hypothetical protein [Trichormus variabilis]MBC1266499.1 hypothetical protein [Trichormus variabilis FSR]
MKLFSFWKYRKRQLRIFAVIISIGLTIFSTTSATNSQTVTRDPWLWPFSTTSIWNMPIGSDAKYIPANIQKAGWFGPDREYFYKLKASDPLRPVYSPGSWTKRCAGTNYMNISLPVPNSLIIPDATLTPYSTPNNASAFLMPDGKTLVQLEPLARCQKSGPIYGWRYYPDLSLSGQGIGGAHFGSGLSSIGGSIRRGGLANDQPIRHAIKFVLWGKKYFYYSSSLPGYRWPADRADNAAATNYGGKNPALVQGTLLAIPPSVTESSLQLQTPVGKKLFRALQNYGAYVVDDAGWDGHYIAVEKGVPEEFKTKYGYSFEASSGTFYNDIMKLYQAVYIVDNNSPTSIGGGGATRRAPLAPPLPS